MAEYQALAQLEATVNTPQYLGWPNVVPGSIETLPALSAHDYAADYAAGMFTLLTPIAETHVRLRFLHTNDPPPPPIKPDYGTDADDLEQNWDQLRTAVTNLRAYLQLATPTAAQSTAALKVLIRLVLAVIRRIVG